MRQNIFSMNMKGSRGSDSASITSRYNQGCCRCLRSTWRSSKRIPAGPSGQMGWCSYTVSRRPNTPLSTTSSMPAAARCGILSVMVWLAARPSMLNACDSTSQRARRSGARRAKTAACACATPSQCARWAKTWPFVESNRRKLASPSRVKMAVRSAASDCGSSNTHASRPCRKCAAIPQNRGPLTTTGRP